MLRKGFDAVYEGTFWRRDLADRRRIARLSRNELQISLDRRFRELARFAIRHSSYFRETADSHHIDPETCLPQDFPELTKKTRIHDFDRIVTDSALSHDRITDFFEESHDPTELLDGRFHVLRTSGSTGTPGYTASTAG